MPDSNLHPLFDAILAPVMPTVAAPEPATVERGDGWLVIGKALATGSVVPPYRFTYMHEHFNSFEDAEAFFNDLETGEHRGWSAVKIVPCKGGVPLGAKAVL